MARRKSFRKWVIALALSLVGSAAVYIGFHVWRLNPSQARIDEARETLEERQQEWLAELFDHALSAQPPGENAWPVYERLFVEIFGADLTRPDRNHENYQTLQRVLTADAYLGEWSDPRFDDCRDALEALSPLLTKLDAAADLPGFAKPYEHTLKGDTGDLAQDYALMSTLLQPELGRLRQLAQWNMAAMRDAAEAGRWDDVERRLRTGLAMASHLSLQSTLIESMIAVSIVSVGHREIGLLAMEHEIDAERCDAILNVLDSVPWPAAPFSHPLGGQEIILNDFVDCMYVTLWLYRAPTKFADQMAQDTEFMIEELMQRWTIAPSGSVEEIGSRLTNPSSPLANLLPAMGQSLSAMRRSISERHAARALLKLRRFHSVHGRWPGDLLEAMSEEDATDPVLGAPLEYELLDSSADGVPFRLAIPSPPEFAGEHVWESPIVVSKRRDPLPPDDDEEW